MVHIVAWSLGLLDWRPSKTFPEFTVIVLVDAYSSLNGDPAGEADP